MAIDRVKWHLRNFSSYEYIKNNDSYTINVDTISVAPIPLDTIKCRR